MGKFRSRPLEYSGMEDKRRETLVSNKTTSLDGGERSLIGGGIYIYHPNTFGSEALETSQLQNADPLIDEDVEE